MNELRPYRVHLREMGQTSPPALAQPVLSNVIGTSVADIGCGSGLYGYLLRMAWHFTASWNVERVTASDRLVGVDFSAVALDRLEKVGAYDELLLAGADGLPLDDESVDTALSMENLEHLFVDEVPGALGELARIARRRVVISTPAPWMVINRTWLAGEIAQAQADPVPMDYDEFLVLSGCIHKSTLAPAQMVRCGFEVVGGVTTPFQVCDSLIYIADPRLLQLDQLGAVTGMAISGYPGDDGRDDWNDVYIELLRASQAITV